MGRCSRRLATPATPKRFARCRRKRTRSSRHSEIGWPPRRTRNRIRRALIDWFGNMPSFPRSPLIEPGAELVLSIEKPAVGGRMLARHDGQVVLVAGTIPGERVRAVVERVAK